MKDGGLYYLGHQFAEFVAASRKLEIGYAVITGAASRVRYS